MAILENKVVLITGGISGIGLATADLFHSEGAIVHAVDLNSPSEGSLPPHLVSPRFFTHQADVTQRDQLDAVVASITAQHPLIDVLICNAGISGAASEVATYPAEVFARVLEVHVMGTFNTVQATLPFIPDQSSIIITSSVTGLVGPPKVSAYATAKHAQVGFMKSLAAELAPRGIRVNTVNPGPVNNGFQNDIEERMTGFDASQANASFNELIPLGRHAEMDEIAQAMLFLAGPHSKMITSTTFRVDGGMAG
jgi:NAD(P)-dependent dehydrogenase (short-subunit alcohol dehydrogenase family)